MTPTARSMKLLRDRGYIVCRVEQTVPRTFIKRDAFGFGDLLVASPTTIGLVQVTTASHTAAREQKIRASEAANFWALAGGRILLHGWAKRGSRGKRKVWTCVEKEIA